MGPDAHTDDKDGYYWLKVSHARWDSLYVGLRAETRGPKNWYVHVSIKESKKGDFTEHAKTQMQGKLEEALGKGAGPHGHIVWSEYCEHGDWTALIPELDRERRDGGGEITESYASKLMEVVNKLKEVMEAVRETGNHEP